MIDPRREETNCVLSRHGQPARRADFPCLDSLEPRVLLSGETPVIVVGDHILTANQPHQAIQVRVSGDVAVDGADIYVQVADGGPAVGGLISGPRIESMDIITGTIFQDNNNGLTDFDGSDPDAVAQWEGDSTTVVSGSVLTNGLLATIFLDTTGFFTGTFDLKMFDTFNGPTDFAGISAQIADGHITIKNSPVADAGGPYAVVEGFAIFLDGSGSCDPDPADTIAAYEWDLDGDGLFGEAGETGPSPEFSASGLEGPDSRTVYLRVSDSDGFVSAVSSAVLSIADTPVIDAPTLTDLDGTPDPVHQGSDLTLTAAAADAGGTVAKIQFFLDANADGVGQTEEKLGEDADGSDGWTWTGPATWAVGPHTYLAVALDSQGTVLDGAGFQGIVLPPNLTVAIGTGQAGSVMFTDADGTKVTVRLTGGTANVVLSGAGLTPAPGRAGTTVRGDPIGAGQDVKIADIHLLAGSANATLAITGIGGDKRITVDQVTGLVSLGLLMGRTADLTGAGIVLTGAGSIRSISVGDLLNGADIITPGSAGKMVSVTAGQVAAGSDMTFGSALGTLLISRWAGQGTLTALSVGALTCRGDFAANVNLTGQDRSGNSLNQFTAGNVGGSEFTLVGGAGIINVASWAGGSIQASYLGTVLSRGGFGATVNVTGNRRGTSLQMASVTGALTSPTITLNGSAGTIIAGSWPSGQLQATTVGSLLSRGAMGATLNLTGQNTAGNSLTLLSAANVNGSALTLAGGAGTVSVASWVGGSIQAAYVGMLISRGGFGATVNVTGNRRGTSLQMASVTGALTSPTITLNGSAGTIIAGSWLAGQLSATFAGLITSRGDFTGNLRLTGSNAQGSSLTLLSITGRMQDAEVRSRGGIGTVSAGFVVNSKVYACVLDAVTALPLAGEFQTVPVPGKSAGITSLTITNPAGVFQNSFVAAPSMGTVTLRGVQILNGGTPFGLAVDSTVTKTPKIASLTRYRTGLPMLTAKNINDSLVGLPAEGDFQVNVV